MQTLRLKGRGDFDEWRNAARPLLLAGVPPTEIDWRLEDEADDLSAFAVVPLPVPAVGEPPAARPPVSVPPAFIELAQSVICHSDPGRFALLYRLLWRIGRDRSLLQVVSDEDVILARRLDKAVRRDSHKMKAFVRFKEVPSAQTDGARRAFVAWFEPDHFIVARMAPFFKRRFFDMDWVIATPKGSATWNGEALTLTDAPAQKPDIEDGADDLWRIYYANIFNPARLKVKAMTAEMPKKYWKNLPEAALIPDLIANAEAKVRDMAEKAASQPPAFHARLQERMAQDAAEELRQEPAGSLEAMRAAARGCTLCPLHCQATQTVFGEGAQDAAAMIVGEQPGDQEDLAGRPFIGPAGKIFDGVLSDVGLPRARLYVTNAVKHFKYEPRGKRRIHQRPNQAEVEQCRFWLKQEVDLVQPKLLVAMGATAYFALTGEKDRLSDVRGKVIAMTEGRKLFVTVHPSYLLRIPDMDRKMHETALFKEDMRSVKQLMDH
ncbi:UdgX family uracil-DNA binding protein [Rhizobium sp. SSA_523]|uniref:UdgX family uracil-DNA binding protein n=1 Tax=Rhizobium sp. SSA_523 TaxID=2952477 RepID=UPI0020916E21|nr:UdgX family uracil-DNA binding protein [Rhizobium sp. SSA_523]MCO5730374.1 UdgX family uracil-DNA binding protein [Rhizobium sp. SSA_523]WKC25418.1 UdgX family uracil-DNA binding protein [Rhizobium sp. SSA_523]